MKIHHLISLSSSSRSRCCLVWLGFARHHCPGPIHTMWTFLFYYFGIKLAANWFNCWHYVCCWLLCLSQTCMAAPLYGWRWLTEWTKASGTRKSFSSEFLWIIFSVAVATSIIIYLFIVSASAFAHISVTWMGACHARGVCLPGRA